MEQIAKKNCKEIKEYLDTINKRTEIEDLLNLLANDERSSVTKLVSKYRRIIEKKSIDEERLLHMWDIEKGLYQEKYQLIAGIDEAGRGPLAGPVVAAAVILPPFTMIPGLRDSKKVAVKEREILSQEVKKQAISWAVGVVDASMIDRINILQATKYAMELALKSLHIRPDFVLVDGPENSKITLPQKGVIDGDNLSASIAAASIIAKVHRDFLMKTYAELYPQYSFDQHKGYGTANHLAALEMYGYCTIHRETFSPVTKIKKSVTI